MESRIKILYAEDDPDIREIAKIALEDLGGFEVKYCNNGKEVIESVNDFKPDLLLLDVMMPEMDGPTTLQNLQKLKGFNNTPVIFMTAKIQSNELAQYQAMGVVDTIIKPFDPMTLANTIRTIFKKNKEVV